MPTPSAPPVIDNANDDDLDGVDDAFAKAMKDIVNGQDIDDLVKISGHRYPQFKVDIGPGQKEADHIAHHGQAGDHDEHGDQWRRHQIPHRADSHDLQGIDFLIDLHGADAGRER